MMNNEPSRKTNWLAALAEMAQEQNVSWPTFDAYGMGALRSAATPNQRYVTLKRRIVSDAQAAISGVEWVLWEEHDAQPVPVAAFRESVEPTPSHIQEVFQLLKGWLSDEWTAHDAVSAVSRHPQAQPVRERSTGPNGTGQQYWLSQEHGLCLQINNEQWSLVFRGRSLTSWRRKSDRTGSEYLDLSHLDRFCDWLAKQWLVIAYGGDVRPISLRGSPVAASRAYENAELTHAIKNADVLAWWGRHAVRAADAEWPNVFFERQGDELVISWDARPTAERIFEILAGEIHIKIDVVVPVLRQLVANRMKLAPHRPPTDYAHVLAHHASAGYAAIRQYCTLFHDGWLEANGLSAHDAEDFALSGTTRNPIVGLLRSSQGSSISPRDFEAILQLLKPSQPKSFAALKEMAKGFSATINSHHPWESGYRLARLIRARLNLGDSTFVDIEQIVRDLGIEIHEVPLSDSHVLGACVGTPGYMPLVVLNQNCSDANGMSGRRVTLAHELCHLLFDRAGLKSLARFEGGGADSDRLMEMRANAFAIELLVPMVSLTDEEGRVMADEQLSTVADDRKVSFHALQRHARNLRNQLTE